MPSPTIPKATRERLLKEALSFTTPKTASSWESNMIRWPLGASSNSGTNETNFLKMAKVDEENARAPTIKPYPMDFISDQIVDEYTSLTKLKKTLHDSLQYPDLSESDIKILRKEIKNITIIIDYMQKMFYNVDRITL